VRFVTAASLFDGHDASINIMRRILQASGCEVIHLGHNRAVEEIVDCALQEDAHGIAISSYQGGHVEFFKYMLDLLRERGAGHVKVFGGGGGVIVPAEIKELHDYGVDAHLLARGRPEARPAGHDQRDHGGVRRRPGEGPAASLDGIASSDPLRSHAHARAADLGLEAGTVDAKTRNAVVAAAAKSKAPVLGITGTGGAGKSSLTDELIRRLRLDQDDQVEVAVISIDPSRRKSGGALLGDRIRMNAIGSANGQVAGLHALARDARRRQRDQQGAARRRSPRARPRASTSSSSRRRASGRATRRSCRTPTSRST
jgi:methylmalonyl-CoA mutase